MWSLRCSFYGATWTFPIATILFISWKASKWVIRNFSKFMNCHFVSHCTCFNRKRVPNALQNQTDGKNGVGNLTNQDLKEFLLKQKIFIFSPSPLWFFKKRALGFKRWHFQTHLPPEWPQHPLLHPLVFFLLLFVHQRDKRDEGKKKQHIQQGPFGTITPAWLNIHS